MHDKSDGGNQPPSGLRGDPVAPRKQDDGTRDKSAAALNASTSVSEPCKIVQDGNERDWFCETHSCRIRQEAPTHCAADSDSGLGREIEALVAKWRRLAACSDDGDLRLLGVNEARDFCADELAALLRARSPQPEQEQGGSMPSDEHYAVFPPSASGGRYSITLAEIGRLMDAFKAVAGEDDPVATIHRLVAASRPASVSPKDEQ
jgi:hypothetical protein